jgi:hypothetical protein
MSEAGFQQAPIAVQNAEDFTALKQLIDASFVPSLVERFLKKIAKAELGIRQFERVLERRLLDENAGERSAWVLYQSLPTSDQGLIREHYLTRIEEVDSRLRAKYQQIYRYW